MLLVATSINVFVLVVCLALILLGLFLLLDKLVDIDLFSLGVFDQMIEKAFDDPRERHPGVHRCEHYQVIVVDCASRMAIGSSCHTLSPINILNLAFINAFDPLLLVLHRFTLILPSNI